MFWRDWSNRSKPGEQPTLSALPSRGLLDAVTPRAADFPSLLVDRVNRDGYLSATIQVALADGRSRTPAARFGDGDDPGRNLCWGALYGIETHFANAADWRRVKTDGGDGLDIIRRVVFHKRSEPTEAWTTLGISKPFDVFVLANAWPNGRARQAMQQPLRDALCGEEPVVFNIDGVPVEFGSGSVVVGYLGPNEMIDDYWEPDEVIGHCPGRQPIGVFYACSLSAVYLHDPAARRGLYPMLFARQPIVPEAYVVDGMLSALLSGELGDELLASAAREYARYQKGLSVSRAREIFFR